MKHRPNVWVVPVGGHFAVREEGSAGNLINRVTQREAIKFARTLARSNRSELIVQQRNGRIRVKDSHGFDQFPPRG
jgi:hypothetical protein